MRQVGLCGLNGCTGLTSLHFPKTLSGVSALAMGECTGLREVTLPGTLKFLDCMAFQNCESLTSVDLPGTLTCLETSTFEGCSSLKRVLLPPNLESLEGKVFSGCRQLKELDFPPSLRTLAEDALDGCTLRRVRFRGEIPDLNPNRLSVEYEGELIADWYPFSGLTEKMKEIVARGVVHRIDKGITITETLRQDVFNWLQENCVSVWRELLFRKFLLSHSLIPLSKYAEIVDLTLEEEDPALTAQVLEYQREHFTDEELGETAWKRYETELDCFRRALCEGQN